MPTKPAAPERRTQDHRYWDKVVSVAYLRMIGHTQTEAASAVGRNARTIRAWEADTELWRAARDEARGRWLQEVEDASRRSVLKAAGRNADLGFKILERLDPAFAPPRQRVEQTDFVYDPAKFTTEGNHRVAAGEAPHIVAASGGLEGRMSAVATATARERAQAWLALQEIDLPERYAFQADAYIREKLGWEPWSGAAGAPGQVEIIQAYMLAIRQQLERNALEQGEITKEDLRYWTPGEVIQNRLRLEAGHTVGKTKLLSGLVNHFFDCFTPSIIYTFAPTWEQIHDLLWKEIKADREGKGLPGRILDLALDVAPNHFAKGRATNNAHGKGTERAQGQHGKFLMFVLDEAEGIPDFVYDAIDSMSSGGVVIVLKAANPRTRTSRFYKVRTRANVRSFRMSCIHHPNVVAGREIVPNAVRREYVETMVEEHCEVVQEHSADDHTFTLPFPVRAADRVHAPGTIFLPDAEFLFRVLGIAPANIADNVFVPVGRYEAACKRAEPGGGLEARIGVDVARYGKDAGTIYVRHGMSAWRWSQIRKQDFTAYAGAIKEAARWLAARGATSLHVRIDAGGGFGGGVNDQVKNDAELRRLFREFRTYEVDFGGTPHREEAYDDMATEMMAEAAETLKGLTVADPPSELEQDLTERTYKWVNSRGVAVKRLTPKEKFKDEHGRSPDDGDGFMLAVAPDFLFTSGDLDPDAFRVSTKK